MSQYFYFVATHIRYPILCWEATSPQRKDPIWGHSLHVRILLNSFLKKDSFAFLRFLSVFQILVMGHLSLEREALPSQPEPGPASGVQAPSPPSPCSSPASGTAPMLTGTWERLCWPGASHRLAVFVHRGQESEGLRRRVLASPGRSHICIRAGGPGLGDYAAQLSTARAWRRCFSIPGSGTRSARPWRVALARPRELVASPHPLLGHRPPSTIQQAFDFTHPFTTASPLKPLPRSVQKML